MGNKPSHEGNQSCLPRLVQTRAEMELSSDGKFIFLLADGKASKVDIDDGKAESINVKGEMVLKTADERSYIFDHSWRQVREKFYVVDLHGVDWDFYYKEYRKFLPYINNNYDFAEMLSEMLGELNASHTGCRYRASSPNSDQTAALGLFYDYDYTGKGLKVAEVIVGGPLDKAAVKDQGRTCDREDRWCCHYRFHGFLPAAEPKDRQTDPAFHVCPGFR